MYNAADQGVIIQTVRRCSMRIVRETDIHKFISS